MVLATKVKSVHIHTTVISPVICQGEDYLEAFLLGQGGNLIQTLEASFPVV